MGRCSRPSSSCCPSCCCGPSSSSDEHDRPQLSDVGSGSGCDAPASHARSGSSDGSSDSDAPQLYGSSSRASIKRMRAEDAMRRAARGQRPSHVQYREAVLNSTAIQQMVVGEHRCSHMWMDGDERVQCTHQLWARSVPAAIAALKKQREVFLAQGCKERGQEVYAALSFREAVQLHGTREWTPPMRPVVYRIGPTPEQQRIVCREAFLAHYPVSTATLKRIVQRKRVGADAYAQLSSLLRQHRTSSKSLHVIAWWIGYAKQVTHTRLHACRWRGRARGRRRGRDGGVCWRARDGGVGGVVSCTSTVHLAHACMRPNACMHTWHTYTHTQLLVGVGEASRPGHPHDASSLHL